MSLEPSYIDELSGIYNRRYLKEKKVEELEVLIAKKIPFSVAWVDLDHFKEVNDMHGHLKGDEIIKEFAQFLKNTLRTSDTIVRYGGDEFVCIMPNTRRKDAEWIYRRILKKCKEREFGGLSISISVGIASHPDDGKDFEELLKIADAALYDAKRSGRDRLGTTRKRRIEIPMKVFIDRIEEKEQLNRLMVNVDKKITIAIVNGNVGIGKTRLAREVLSHIIGKEIVWSDCLSFAGNIAYYPIRELIKYRIERKGKDILEDVPLGYKIEIGKLIPEVMEEIKGKVEGIGLVLDKYRFYESVKKVIEIGEREKIIVVDNVQWIDKESIEVIKYLLRSLKDRPITFLFIYRTEEKTELLEKFIADISRENELRKIALEAFGYNEIKESVKTMIGEEPEKELVEYMVSESGGNPFYIEEIMKMLVEGRYLTIEEDRCRFKEPEVRMVPNSIEGVAMRKYQSLSKEAQNVLEIASVVGWFDVEIIKEITDYNEGHIIGLIEDISRAGMTKEARGRIEFEEEICRNAIYKRNIEGLKEWALHKKVGELIEKRSDGQEEEVIEELAFHYYRGHEREKGIGYCLQAGDRAMEKYANRHAIKYYTWAKELLGEEKEENEGKTRIDCLLKRAQVLTLIGNNEDAVKDLGEGLREARAIGDKEREVNTLCKRARTYLNITEIKKSLEDAEKCRRISEEVGNRRQIAEALNVIALVRLDLKEYEEAMSFFREALKIFKQIENKVGVARVLNNIGIIYFELGELQSALKFFEDGLKIAGEIGHKVFEGNMVGNIGNVYYELGDYTTALKFYQNGLKIAREIGHQLGEGINLTNTGFIYTLFGEYKTALKFLEDALEITREIGHKIQEISALDGLGDIYYCKGEYNIALGFYEEAREILKQAKSEIKNVYSNLCFGDLYVALNKMKKAKGFLDKAHKEAKEINSEMVLSRVLVSLSAYYLEIKEFKKSKETLVELKGLQKELKSADTEGEIEFLSGRYYTGIKDYSKAEEDLKRALHIFKELKEKFNIGRVNYYLGGLELIRDDKSHSRQYLNESLRIFKSINANGWKEKTEKALSSCR